MPKKIEVPEHLKPVYDRLKKSPCTNLQWANETGSTRLAARCFDLRELNINVQSRWIVLKSGIEVKQYFIS